MKRSFRRTGIGAVGLSFVLAIALGLSGVIAPSGSVAVGASTTLTIISGEVSVSHLGGDFATASDGELIGVGDVVRTGADSRAVLTYFEGSTVSIEPLSEVAVDELRSEADGDTIVVMTQSIGRTWHVVTKLLTGDSRYEVRTPAATASVRGTAFEVGVERLPDGEFVSTIITTEGAVAAAAPPTVENPAPEPVVVVAGFKTTSKSTEPTPEKPTRAPEPERKVTVSIDSKNSLVVDPLGRSNGMRDGKVILQTPGAQLSVVNGRMVVTMPDLPDGKLSTVVGDKKAASNVGRAPVEVVTTVEVKGKPTERLNQVVKPEDKPLTGVDVGEKLRSVDEAEIKDLKEAKIPPTPVEVRKPIFRPGSGAVSEPEKSKDDKDEKREDDDDDRDDPTPSPAPRTVPVDRGSDPVAVVRLSPVPSAPSVQSSESDDDDRDDDDANDKKNKPASVVPSVPPVVVPSVSPVVVPPVIVPVVNQVSALQESARQVISNVQQQLDELQIRQKPSKDQDKKSKNDNEKNDKKDKRGRD